MIDQTGHSLTIPGTIRSVVSTVPSITLTLFDLGLGHLVKGRTKFCIHPSDKINAIPKIGGTKNLKLEDIHRIDPDIIIANKEENERQDIETLMDQYPVYISDVIDLDTNYAFIQDMGSIFDKVALADQIVTSTSKAFNNIVSLIL